MENGKPSRTDLEVEWQRRVQKARAKYREEAERFTSILAAQSPLSSGLNSDGALEIRKAREKESEALAEYSRMLRTFTDLVVKGIEPKE